MADVDEPKVVEDLGLDLSLKKKKKKSKTPDAESTPEPTVDDDEDMLAGLKKKKKKSKDASAKADGVDEVTDAFDDLKLKKKKKKKATVIDDFDAQLEKAGVLDDDNKENSPEAAEIPGETTSIKYEDLLHRFFNILRENNPELAGGSGSKLKVPPPVCQREGNKKTLFANVQEIAAVLQRNPEHIIQYLFAELGTSGSIDGQKRLIMRGRFQPKHIENVLRRYIAEYVTCETCKSMNTELKRESANRLHFIVCKACGSTKSVSSIKTGFQAHVGRRKK
ncbi:unnamed protein product [Kuraishia capsulata CBS 1993]|uniref:Translation initiation factor IF2/IF5 domain-containing protein n=1 Tax=Kuraishia capsulata CBS 1993 TaxID=1382522 RepID=W6MF62_9ASCO|nr:uncharacterized protein KUCA_T00000284001 [Kuraishia capsulata CBS 1993]CDK24324.1 unnamed protein product [Kuraishia capsulata CBS 1993]